MARQENPPFPRGGVGTHYSDPYTIDTTDGSWKEGLEWVFEDKDFSNAVDGVIPDRTYSFVTCRIVRNASGSALLPKRFAKFKTDGTAAQYLGQVSGYGDTVGQIGGVVDEFLPAAGAAANDLFWLVVEGVTNMTTASSGDTNMALGAMVIPSTSGTIIEQDTTVAAGAATFNQIQGAIGHVCQAVNATATDVLVCVRRMQ